MPEASQDSRASSEGWQTPRSELEDTESVMSSDTEEPEDAPEDHPPHALGSRGPLAWLARGVLYAFLASALGLCFSPADTCAVIDGGFHLYDCPEWAFHSKVI